MKKFLKKIVEYVFGYALVTLLILAIISVIAILGGGLMHFFGFEYNSIGSIILYFILVTVVGFPIEIFTKAFPKALKSLGKIDIKTERILFVLLDTIGTGIVMAIIDYFMKSVSASDLAILIVAFIIAILSLDE